MDRNCSRCHSRLPSIPSLSARRAWIEIHYGWSWYDDFTVALRKESVDRNAGDFNTAVNVTVALRKESVDRNSRWLTLARLFWSRSPQGERG